MFRYAKFSVLTLSLVAVISSAVLAGPVDGPKSIDRCLESDDQVVKEVAVWANRSLTIQVVGEGTSDLDLYVYDMSGNLIDSDTSVGDDLYVHILRPRTTRLTIVVVNSGTANDCFELVVE